MAEGTELCKAYVQIVPSTRGLGGSLTEALTGEGGKAGESAGESAGARLVAKLKGIIAAAGIGAVVKQALDAGGALQQSFGGLDTIYEEAGESAKAYAREAYKAGISANDYAEQAVSFGAALKAAYGDNAKAAEAANIAIMDMADNSAKMGTDIGSIQNAYQGFAKQNYTMLDNLKLGYGGTKSEMERLLKDATALSGVKYNIDNLGDVYSAIHVIQENLGLTGVAAYEAEGTFTGSMGAMKASAENLLAYMTTGEGDLVATTQSLVGNALVFVGKNMIPMLLQLVASIPVVVGTVIQTFLPQLMSDGMSAIDSIIEGIRGGLPGIDESALQTVTEFATQIGNLLPMLLTKGIELVSALLEGAMSSSGGVLDAVVSIMEAFVSGVVEYLPTLYENGYELITLLSDGVLANLPTAIVAIGNIITNVIQYIMQNFPTILSKGIELVKHLASGVVRNIPAIISAIASVIAQLLATIGQNFPSIIAKGFELLTQLCVGIINAIPLIPGYIASVISSITSAFTGYSWGDIGRNIIDGIANGLSGAASTIKNAALEAAKSAFQSVKDFFGIKSPSRLMRDVVGKNIVLGMVEGIEGEVDSLEHTMNSLGEMSMDAVSQNVRVNATNGNDDVLKVLGSILGAIEDGKTLQINGRDFGRLVKSYA